MNASLTSADDYVPTQDVFDSFINGFVPICVVFLGTLRGKQLDIEPHLPANKNEGHSESKQSKKVITLKTALDTLDFILI
ncbi:2640_t:CDS:1, partial [Ambispora leptoticha]